MSISEKRKAYLKEYFKRSEVKKKQKERLKKYLKTAKGKEAQRKNNKIIAEKRKIDRKLNPEKYRAKDKKIRERIQNNPEKLSKRKEYAKKYRQSFKGKEYLNKYQQSPKGKEILKRSQKINTEKRKIDRKLNPEKYRARDKKNRQRIMNDPVKLKKRRETLNIYQKRRRETDVFFRIRNSLTARLSQFLRISNTVKRGSILNLIGCSKEFLKSYLEKKFYDNPSTKEKMTWKNYGRKGWEIDHKRPVSDFKSLDLSSLIIQKQIMHYSNLQPMWRKENRSKSDLIYLINSSPEYKKTLFFKEFNPSNTLKDLDEYVKKKIKKFDPDLEIELSVARNSKRQYLVWIKSKLEN